MTEEQIQQLIDVLECIDLRLNRIAEILEEAAGWSQDEDD